jgi:flagellin-like hook-associated protein FlgL
MSDITLSAGVRQNLLSLQNTASLMAQTQNRLATGKKVNSALDNPLNFFTSQSLSARAGDLNGLLDSMSNGIQTIQAANNGLTAMTKLVQQLQATVSQARSDASGGGVTPGTALNLGDTNNSTLTNNKLTFDVGGGTTVSIDTYTHVNATVATLNGNGADDLTADLSAMDLKIDDGNGAVAVDLSALDGTANDIDDVVDAINTSLSTAGSTIQATKVGTEIKLTNITGKAVTVSGADAAYFGFGTGNTTADNGVEEVSEGKSVDDLVSAINNNAVLADKVKAAKDADGKLTLQNLTTSAISVTGSDGTYVTGDVADATTLTAGTGGALSSVRQSLLNQFNDLLTQIDNAATDAGYNGINLLNGDDLKLNFNENGTSTIDVQATDSNGVAFAINSANLGINTQTTNDFGSNTSLDALSAKLSTALTTLRTQASALGSSLSIVQTRQDFTKAMVNTLQVGSDNLVLADTNEEGANMLALQTRQSLSTTALSLASQADQNVLRLFG